MVKPQNSESNWISYKIANQNGQATKQPIKIYKLQKNSQSKWMNHTTVNQNERAIKQPIKMDKP